MPEYLTMTVEFNQLQDVLNSFTSDGWEPVLMCQSLDCYGYDLVLERRP